MQTLWAASIRHLLRHPAQLGLALVGLCLGVATIVAVDIATASSQHAFELSLRAVNGTATHQIVGGPDGIDEQLYVDLRSQAVPNVAEAAQFSAVVEGYVTVADRTLQLVGLDPLAAAALAAATRSEGTSSAPSQWLPARGTDLSRWLAQRGTVVMAERTARQLGLTGNGSFAVEVGGKSYPATLLFRLQEGDRGYDSLLLTDISQAQEWLGMVGRLSRIDVRIAAASGTAGIVARLRQRLPPGVQLNEAHGGSRDSFDMASAFTTNLKAMSLLALLVSTLLIYGAISFAVVQRRRIFGILRALGATRGEVLLMVFAEALVLGVVGAVLGMLLGLVIGSELVHLVSRTINDLYFVVAVNTTTVPAASLLKALLAGVGTALAAALVPAVEAVASAPQLGLRRSALEERATYLARKLVLVSAALAAGAGLIVIFSSRSLMAGFVALFMLLLSIAAVTPAVLRAMARAAAQTLGGISPVARLAFGDIASSLSRTGVAVAALGMAVAAMIGVSIMVGSFRETLHEWLGRTMRADIYVTAPGPGAGRPERRLDPEVVTALTGNGQVADYSLSRSEVVQSAAGPVQVDGLRLAPMSRDAFQLIAGDPRAAWPAFERGGIVISEPLAWRLRLGVGDCLTLSTSSGPHDFKVAAVYREYGNDRGNVLLNLAIYRSLWRDQGITALGIYLRPGTKPQVVLEELRAAAGGRQALLMRSNADIRALSMSIFDRTFVITRVLNWLAAGVAAVGLVSSLLAWELERARELAIIRTLGLTAGGAALLIEAQTLFMGLTAVLAAIPAGILTALVLIDVINRRAFGWRIDLHLHDAQFTNALLLSLTAALLAGLYPAWRVSQATLASEIREE